MCNTLPFRLDNISFVDTAWLRLWWLLCFIQRRIILLLQLLEQLIQQFTLCI